MSFFWGRGVGVGVWGARDFFELFILGFLGFEICGGDFVKIQTVVDIGTAGAQLDVHQLASFSDIEVPNLRFFVYELLITVWQDFFSSNALSN